MKDHFSKKFTTRVLVGKMMFESKKVVLSTSVLVVFGLLMANIVLPIFKPTKREMKVECDPTSKWRSHQALQL